LVIHGWLKHLYQEIKYYYEGKKKSRVGNSTKILTTRSDCHFTKIENGYSRIRKKKSHETFVFLGINILFREVSTFINWFRFATPAVQSGAVSSQPIIPTLLRSLPLNQTSVQPRRRIIIPSFDLGDSDISQEGGEETSTADTRSGTV